MYAGRQNYEAIFGQQSHSTVIYCHIDFTCQPVLRMSVSSIHTFLHLAG